MASSQTHLFFLFGLLFLTSHTTSQKPLTTPTALVLPISKHPSTLQYTTTLPQTTTTPLLLPLTVVVDLGGPFLWLSCSPKTHNSSTFKSAQCHSPHCSLAHPTKTCNKNKSCIVFSNNVFTGKVLKGELSEDALSLHSTDGLNPTSIVSAPQFPFLCVDQDFLSLEGLATGARGVAGLGHGLLGLPAQLASTFNFTRKFATCLSSSSATGVVFFGDGPYGFFPGIDISKLLIFTPLVLKPKTHPYEYHIRVKSISINGKKLPLNSSTLLTKISTVNPYTILETSLYKSLTRVFVEAANATRVASESPFEVCFSTKSGDGSLMRPAMPVLDLVLQSKRVFWRIFETNSMVEMGNETACLGFLDGGSNPGASITIGGYQLEDNLLQFDLVSSRLGFTNSLLWRETNCASFNFTSSN